MIKSKLNKIVMLSGIIAILASGCNSSDKTEKYTHDTTYIDADGNPYMFLAQIPDSLRTREQQLYIKRLVKIVNEYTHVKDNQFVFKLSKDEFLARGLSKYDYDLTLKGIRDNNAYIEEKGLNADSLKKDMKREVEKL